MSEIYSGVKFYGKNDWSIGENLEKAEIVFEAFDKNEEYTDINKVIELYNIQELLNSGVYLKKWDEESINHYKELSSLFTEIIGRFFGKIGGENFSQICNSVCIEYIEDYWELIVKFKVFQKVSKQAFSHYINEPGIALWVLLQQEVLVKYYGKELAELMRISEQTPRLIVSKYLQRNEGKHSCFFPKELDASEYEEILQRYISSETANLNVLQLLAQAQSSKDCPISDKLRLAAKRACDSYWKKRPFIGAEVEYGIGVKFADISELKRTESLENNNYQVTYDIKWLMENLDYPTILNNFRYIFDQFDICWRSSLVSVESQLGNFERTLFVRGIKDYAVGSSFSAVDNLTTMQMISYYSMLKNNDVQLENVFKWFFEEYLSEEFHVRGFRFNPPSEGTTLVEKCRTIASEMEGVLKQFRMYVQDGEIDRELFEMSSEHIIFSNLSGFVKYKYAYRNSNDIQNEQLLLFSDQSLLHYIEKTKSKYTCFYDLLIHENVSFSDFKEYQNRSIHWLIEHDIVLENSNGYLELNLLKVFILKDLYEHDVICSCYYDDGLRNIVDEWQKNGDLRFSDNLFSKPEQDYLNYELNKSVFSNGLDLRNKYSHSTYPENEKIQFADYARLLKIMVLVITKINEEFCLREEINKSCEKKENT